MTKTLTEQWYDNTIDRSHHYYVRVKGKEEMNCGGIDFIDIIRPPLFRDQLDKLMKYNDPEVLAPVPSYDEYKRLQEQLNEANEALKCIRYQVKIGEFPCDACGYSMKCEGCWCGDLANDYLEKWGVK